MSRLADELREGTAHGDVYVRRLKRAQLALAMVSLVAFGGLVGALPLLLLLVPALSRARLLGVPLAIWLVVVPPSLVFLTIASLHQRRADALDAAFGELVRGERAP